jgi:hypothetical protein
MMEGTNWQMIKFNAIKDDIRVPLTFKIFTYDFGTEINGLKANIYFSFPTICESRFEKEIDVKAIDFIN